MKEMIGKRDGVLKRFRKTVTVGADVTSDGRLFQRQHSATGNAQSPTMDSCVRRITSCMGDDDQRRWMWSERYRGGISMSSTPRQVAAFNRVCCHLHKRVSDVHKLQTILLYSP